MKTLLQLKPVEGTYVRLVENPCKEPLTIKKFYKVLPGPKIKDDKGCITYSLGKFETLPPNYLNAFK